ncbi:uncharacterized protein LOC143893553 [Temnothorax americanus]|uniref:uncharacterized protein LOC143893553 n=1 Tax=Temnothorax americanus TaxID=1964332 RepID=UPI00406823A3
MFYMVSGGCSASSPKKCRTGIVVSTLHVGAKSYTDIELPITLNQIKNFENHNDISINVFSIEKKNMELAILPIRITDQKMDRHVNLLYVHDDNVGHFAWIKNLSRLVSSQINRHRGRKYFCDRCLHYFYTSEKLEAHTVDCREMNDCAIKLPSDDDKWLALKNHSRRA